MLFVPEVNLIKKPIYGEVNILYMMLHLYKDTRVLLYTNYMQGCSSVAV